MSWGRPTTLALFLLLALGTPAYAAEDPAPTVLTLTAERAFADTEAPITLTLVADDGGPVAGASIILERRVDGTWREVADLETDVAGQAVEPETLERDSADNTFRASYAGDEIHAASRSGRVNAPLRRRETRARIQAADSVVDEERVVVGILWKTRGGIPVSGRVRLFRRNGDGDWKLFRRPSTNRNGIARVRVRPRVDTRWKVRAPRLDWVFGDRSPVHRIDNLPPGLPVRLPSAAPRPRVNLPDQGHARGEGANARVTRIPDGVWRQMTGRSWHRGCPVGRSRLRLLRINYWAYDGYRHRGELVAHADAIGNMRGALVAMYERKLPLRSLYRVDRFGWSDRVHGADDYRSMAAGNTSAFNCRDVVGRPGVRSPHSWGRALDLNTWENPYHASHGWTPNSWWAHRSHPRVAWRSRDHAVVQIMRDNGFRWTYGTEDSQHFDVPAGSGRVIVARSRSCDGAVCH